MIWSPPKFFSTDEKSKEKIHTQKNLDFNKDFFPKIKKKKNNSSECQNLGKLLRLIVQFFFLFGLRE